MTSRQLQVQVRTLMAHTYDAKGQLQPKLVKAIFDAVASSKWSHKRALLKALVREVARIESKHKAVIVSATELSPADRTKITELVKAQHSHITDIEWQRQADLLAGIVVKVADIHYDFSVRDRLQQVQEHLA